MRRRKYNNRHAWYNGNRYDSIVEAEYAEKLTVAMLARVIKDFHRQVKLSLGVPENVYVVDFVVYCNDGAYAVDVKGMETPKFKRDRRLWAAYGSMPLLVVSDKQQYWVLPEKCPAWGASAGNVPFVRDVWTPRRKAKCPATTARSRQKQQQ